MIAQENEDMQRDYWYTTALSRDDLEPAVPARDLEHADATPRPPLRIQNVAVVM